MRLLFRVAALFGLIGVVLGALGAHALKNLLSGEMVEVWHTGTLYHLVHSVMGIVAALCYAVNREPRFKVAGWLFLTGVVLFSGSLYVVALTSLHRIGEITPLGGVAFILGWLWLFLGASSFEASKAEPETP